MPALPLLLALALAPSDWLVTPAGQPSRLSPGPHPKEITLSNGLVRRTWRIDPNAATVRFDNLVTGQSLIRSVRPEAILEIDGARITVGGLSGQPEHAYLKREWLDTMTADPAALRYTSHTTGPIRRSVPMAARPPCTRRRMAAQGSQSRHPLRSHNRPPARPRGHRPLRDL